MRPRALALGLLVGAPIPWTAIESQGPPEQRRTPVQAPVVVDRMLAETPRDPRLLRQRWLLLLAAAQADTGEARRKRLVDALAAGDSMVNVAPDQADSLYYVRKSRIAALVTSDSVVSFMRELATTARSGSLKLAELRGLPLDNANTYSLKPAAPAHWTCTLRVDSTMVTVRCNIPQTLAGATAEFDRLAGLLDDAIGSRGWGREKEMVDGMLRTGAERAVSYDFRRNRRLIALVNLQLRSSIENPRVSATAERWLILTVRGFASSGA